MTTGNAVAFCRAISKGIADYLHTAGAGDEAAAERHIMSKYVFKCHHKCLNIFSYYSNVNGNTCFAEYSIYTRCRTLKDTFVGERIPGFAGCQH